MLKIVLILIAAFAISACGDNSDEIVGIWKGIIDGDIFIWTFDNNGRFTATDNGHTDEGAYFVDGNLLQLNFDPDVDISDGILIINFSINGNLMTWVLTLNGEQQTILLERGL